MQDSNRSPTVYRLLVIKDVGAFVSISTRMNRPLIERGRIFVGVLMNKWCMEVIPTVKVYIMLKKTSYKS